MGEIIAIVAVGLLWSFLNGELSWANILFGMLLGLLMLSVMERNVKRGLPARLRALLTFLAVFLREVVVSGFVNVRLSLSPRPRFHPQIVQVPLTVQSNAAISLLGLAIALIPGTVPMAISGDRRFLYCHAVNQPDPETHRRSILNIESLILRFME